MEHSLSEEVRLNDALQNGWLFDNLEKAYLEHGKLIIAYDLDDTVRPFRARSCSTAVNTIKRIDAVLKPWWIVYTANPNVEKNKNTIKELGLPCDAINDYPDDPIFDKFREQQVTYPRTKLYYNLLLDDKTMGLCLGLSALELLADRREMGDYDLQLGEYKEEKE